MAAISLISVLLSACQDGEQVTASEPFGEVFVAEERVVLETEADDPLGAASDIAEWGDVIAVSDGLAKNVKVFARNGSLVRTLGRAGDGPGEFRYPTSLVVDDRGRLGVLDLQHSRVHFFDEEGTLDDAFQFEGVYTGGMTSIYDGRRLLISTRLIGRDARDSVRAHFGHVLDLQGRVEQSFGRWPRARDRAETPFMGISLALAADSCAVWGLMGRHSLFFQPIAHGDAPPTDTVPIPGLLRPDWSKAPETEPDLWNWSTEHELLTGLLRSSEMVVARFIGGDPEKGQEWYRYAAVSLESREVVAVTDRTDAYLQTWTEDGLLGIEIRSDGRAYLTRYRLRAGAAE